MSTLERGNKKKFGAAGEKDEREASESEKRSETKYASVSAKSFENSSEK